MRKRKAVFLLLAVALLVVLFVSQRAGRRVEHARAIGRSKISFYGQDAADDNGLGLSGVNLLAFKPTSLKWQGNPVYPVAVAEKDWPQYAYKVIRISGKGLRTIYGVVLDACEQGNANCDKNVRQFGFLIDVHRAGFGAIGKRDGLFAGSFETVGSLSAADIPDGLWDTSISRGSDYLQCRLASGRLGWVAFKDRRNKCR